MPLAPLIVKVLCGWAALAVGFSASTLLGTLRLWRRARRVGPPPRWPALAILRPCEGADAGLAENLLSSATARYDGAREVWCLVPDEQNAAWAAAEEARRRAAERAPDVAFHVVATRVSTPANRKAAQLHVGAKALGPSVEVVVQADSDVRFDDELLPRALSALEQDPAIAAVAAPPVEVGEPGAPRSLVDRLSATVLSSSHQSFLALGGLATSLGGTALVGGALFAIRKSALALVDDWRALEPFLGEDFELNRRLLAAGHRVAMVGSCARCVEGGRTLGEALRRFARWALVLKRQRPPLFATYFFIVACTPLLVAADAVAVAARWPHAWLAVAGTGTLIAVRAALASYLRRAAHLAANPLSSLSGALAGELMLLGAATIALFSSRIVWRGRKYRVGKAGRLEPA